MDAELYEQVIFTRDGDADLDERHRYSLRWEPAAHNPVAFHEALRQIVEGSLDTHDARVMAEDGVDAAIRPYVEVDERHFVRDPQRSETAWEDDLLVGLIQPVLYRQGHTDPRPEGTVNYIGVVPRSRGKGYIHDLLLRATAHLYEQRVWRIFCTTDVGNVPMIAAFEKLGYVRGGVRKVPLR